MEDIHRQILHELASEPTEEIWLAQLLDIELSDLIDHLKFLAGPNEWLVARMETGVYLTSQGALRREELESSEPQ